MARSTEDYLSRVDELLHRLEIELERVQRNAEGLRDAVQAVEEEGAGDGTG